ncbi:MAG: alpha/beta hydrolase [Bacteroidota bacterium]
MKILKILLLGLGILLFLLIVGFFLGPKPSFSPVDAQLVELNVELDQLDAYLAQKEAKFDKIKQENQSRIIWADSIRKTPYSIVYLHGFSASPMEGNPLHQEFAARYGSNLYLPRLAGHGLDDPDSFAELTPEALIASAKEAIAVGQLIGDKVILMSCSTGGTLSIYLSAHHPEVVHAQLMYAPNLALYDVNAQLLTGPWGAQLTQAILGDYYHINHMKGKPAENFWTTTYRTEGVIALQALLDQTMTEENFRKITTPYLIAYYYKNEEEQDKVISTAAITAFDKVTATEPDKKQLAPLPDVKNHVLTSNLMSQDLDAVRKVSFDYAEKVLGMRTVEQQQEAPLVVQ